MKVYGPVPSRRLSKSLGVNNIPPKICSYSCVYCQLGSVPGTSTKRKAFYSPEELASQVKEKIKEAKEKNNRIDYICFVSDGEPTLDINIGNEIDLLKPLGIKIAVITNSSLLFREDTRKDLRKADWVSLKIDAVSKEIWKKINRPHRSLDLEKILEGICEFAKDFQGELATETMLIYGINDNCKEIQKIASFLFCLQPDKAYLSVPIRPPAEEWIKTPPEETINRAYQIFNKKLKAVEYLIGYEGNEFASTGNTEEDILSITSVHPMREDAIDELLKKNNKGWDMIEKLIKEKKITATEYNGKRFYLRRFN